MRPLNEWDRSDLDAIVAAKLEEGQDLEFKSSGSLVSNPHAKAEIAKDVSALANAAGGRIIYGIKEDGHGVAKAVDEGTSQPADWLEQIISSNVEPAIAGLVIKRIPLDDGKAAFIVDVPKATTLAPHQSRVDHCYYHRRSKTVDRMLHHEILDAMNRTKTPELYLDFQIYQSPVHLSGYHVFGEYGNLSNEPANYSIVSVACSARLVVMNDGNWRTNPVSFRGRPMNLYIREFTSSDVPIFKENPISAFDMVFSLPENSSELFGYKIATAGFRYARSGFIIHPSNKFEPVLYWKDDLDLFT